MGQHLGRSKAADGNKSSLLELKIKVPLTVGDRLRLHLEPSGERLAFTLKGLRRGGKEIRQAKAGQVVEIELPSENQLAYRQLDLYKIDVAHSIVPATNLHTAVKRVKNELAQAKKIVVRRRGEVARKIWGESQQPPPVQLPAKQKGGQQRASRKGRQASNKFPLEWWLKVDSAKLLFGKLPVRPDRYLLPLERRNFSQAGELKRILGRNMRSVTWALPAILVDRETARLKKQIATLLKAGYRSFQLGHMGQLELFRGQRVFLCGDYTLNLLNDQALLQVVSAGFESVQLAIESDRVSLAQTIQGYKQTGIPASRRPPGNREMRLGLTVYGAPPLFTSRLTPDFFPYDKSVFSPKNEPFVISKDSGWSQTRPAKPFSLLSYVQEMKHMGLDYVVVDLTGGRGGKKDMQELSDRLTGGGRRPKLSTFNYLGNLM